MTKPIINQPGLNAPESAGLIFHREKLPRHEAEFTCAWQRPFSCWRKHPSLFTRGIMDWLHSQLEGILSDKFTSRVNRQIDQNEQTKGRC